MTRCIYKIINIKNNKFYVGSAVDFKQRKARHVWKLRANAHANKHLQAAWNFYGENSFIFCVVEEIPEAEDLAKAEDVWLEQHVGKDYCYNLAQKASCPRIKKGPENHMWGKTFSHTEEAKAKISKASKERVQSEEEKRKRRETMRGHEVPIETRAKISASLSGDKNPWYGKKRPEHSAKVSKPVQEVTSGRVFRSLTEALVELDLKMPTLRRALVSGQPLTRGPRKGLQFRYVDSAAHPSAVFGGS